MTELTYLAIVTSLRLLAVIASIAGATWLAYNG